MQGLIIHAIFVGVPVLKEYPVKSVAEALPESETLQMRGSRHE